MQQREDSRTVLGLELAMGNWTLHIFFFLYKVILTLTQLGSDFTGYSSAMGTMKSHVHSS
jgi:hypothetical protein